MALDMAVQKGHKEIIEVLNDAQRKVRVHTCIYVAR